MRAPSGQELAAWQEGPSGGTPLVLLHGLTMTGDQAFAGVTALTRRGLRCVCFDARGHGRSAAAIDGDYGYRSLLADLEAVIDALEIERALLAGISMGAHTALRLALEHPDRVAGLAVVSPAFNPANHPDEEHLAEADALAVGLAERGPEGFVAALRVPRGLTRDAPIVRAGHALTRRRLVAHRDLAALADALRGNLRARPFGDLGALAGVAAPAMVVGTRDEFDPRHPYALARAYADALPDSSFTCEAVGQAPLGWGGKRLIAAVGEFAEGVVAG